MKQQFLILLLTLFSNIIWAQNITVTGKVTSQNDHLGIPGVSIVTKGTTTGTTTDINGFYKINTSPDANLVFSFVGMLQQEIAVNNQKQINVVMQESSTGLEEVVVIGYGIQTKKDITGSIAQVKADELKNISSISPMQSVQGKMAGVQVVNSSAPGAAPKVRIRGVGSMLSGVDPLYVVDGVITGDIRNINQADILTVDVLKDASSAAIYGVRGANGVVIITTKSGSKGKMEVNFDSKLGVHKIINEVEMANSKLFAEYSNEAAEYHGNEMPYDLSKIKYNTNWLDAITRESFTQEHNLSINGGGQKSTYFLSLGYMQDQGVLKTNDYSRFTVRLNNSHQLTDKIKLGNNLSISRYKSNNVPFETFTEAYRQAPTVPVKDENGDFGYSARNNVANPAAKLHYNNNRNRGTRIQGSVFTELEPLKNLKFKSTFSVDASYSRERIYTPKYEVSPTQKAETSSLTAGRGEYTTWIWDNILSYSFQIGEKHDFKFMAGTTAEKMENSTLKGFRQNVPPQSQYWYLNAGDPTTATNENFGDSYTRNSYLGRFSYAFNNKYLLTATFRRDGSSKFSKQKQWANSPSIGLGWRISEENFMQNTSWLSNLKLRASWGKLGNDNIASNAFRDVMSKKLYVLGSNQTVVNGTTIEGIKDLGLQWEQTTEYDLGIEFGLLNNKITGELDYYNKETSDALINAPIDAIFGANSFLTNMADIRNEGIEMAVNWHEQINEDLSFRLGANLSHNKNTIENVGNGFPIVSGSLGNGQSVTRTQKGEEIGSFWVYQTDGIFQSQAEVDAYVNDEGQKMQNPEISVTRTPTKMENCLMKTGFTWAPTNPKSTMALI